MKRYMAKPPRPRTHVGDDYWWRQSDGAWDADDGGSVSMTVEEDDSDTFSGLYDADGNELHRRKQRIGFLP